MPRIRFTADHDYRPKGAPWTIAYKAGHEGPVKQDCADEAVALGRAVLVGKKKAPGPAAPDGEGGDGTERGG